VLVLLTCLVLTVLFDMVRAGGVGLLLAGASPGVRLKLRRTGIRCCAGQLAFVLNLERARRKAQQWLEQDVAPP